MLFIMILAAIVLLYLPRGEVSSVSIETGKFSTAVQATSIASNMQIAQELPTTVSSTATLAVIATVTPRPRTPTSVPTPTNEFVSTNLDSIGGQWAFEQLNDITGSVNNGDGLLLFESHLTDFAFTADVLAENREASLALRMQDARNGYILIFVPTGSRGGNAGLYLVRRTNGRETTLAWTQTNLPSIGEWANLAISVTEYHFVVSLNGQVLINYTDQNSSRIPSGAVGFRVYGDRQSPCSARFRLVELHRLS